jgi:zinc and cadmium transporter
MGFYILVLFFSTLLSGLLYLAFQEKYKKNLKLILGFSGGFLLAVSIISLIPETFEHANAYTGIFLLLGFYLQFILDYFSHGIEHGHVHHHNHNHDAAHSHHHHETKSPPSNKSGKGIVPWIVFGSLCLHAILEGLPLGLPIQNEMFNAVLIAGIIIHNLPISMALVDLLTGKLIGKQKVLMLITIFSIMTPLGILITHQLGNHFIHDIENFSAPLFAFVIGIFLHLSTTILFESSENHTFQGKKLLSIIIGSLAAVLMLSLFPH